MSPIKNFELKYKNVDELFNFITGNDKLFPNSAMKPETNALTNKKKSTFSKKMKSAYKTYEINPRTQISNFNDSFSFNFNTTNNQNINIFEDVETIKKDLIDNTIMSDGINKIIPIITDEWIQHIINLGNNNV
jgi:hypothetical protein